MKTLSFKNMKFSRMNGILAILFGVIALLFPKISLVTLAIIFAISILLGGISLLISIIRKKESTSKWYYNLLEGIIGVLIGIIIISQPESAVTFFVVIIGLWATALGLVFLISYFKRDESSIQTATQLIVGIISVLIGLLIILNPFESTRIIAVLIGLYAIAYGTFSLVRS